MRRLLVTLFVLSEVCFAASYEVRPAADTSFALTVEKTGLMRGKKHLFLFEKYEGTLQFDSQRPTEAKIQLTIDSRSIICKDDWVSASDLKTIQKTALDDMLAASQYPSMMFSSGTIKALGGDRYEAQGILTIRDLPKTVAVTVQLNAANPALLRLTGSATIKLTDYKLKPPSAILGAIGTKDEMTLNFTISALRRD